MYYTGIIIAVATFLTIGLWHPIVIKTEYYWGTRPWIAYLAIGVACIVWALFIEDTVLSAIVGVFGASALWGIGELFSQRKRVQKGWFPMNPKRKDEYSLCFLLLAVGLAACGGGSRKDAQVQVKYETRVMKPESRVYNLYIPASLHGVSEVDVYPQVSGIIREVNFKDGIKVTKGQTLFVIDQTEHRLRVQNAQANLAAAKAQMETTKLQYETNQKLAEKEIVSDYVLSTNRNAYHVAQAAVQQAQAQLAIAQTNLGYCTIKSPITGIIKENGFKIGELADLTELLCTVSDNSEIQAWFSYTESQLLDLLNRYDLKPSAEGLKDIDGKTAGTKLPRLQLQLKNGQTYKHEGVVTEIGGIVDSKTGTIICKATFPNPDDELRSGLSATLVFPTTMNNVFRIPKTAAVHLQNQLLFYRVKKDGTVEGVICEAIPSNSGKNYYVKSGLNSGDEVVINGVQNLSNGVKVK